jgi:hypothetical protein
MPNEWIKHIKKFSKENNIPYACAMCNKSCIDSYQKSKNSKNKINIEKPKMIEKKVVEKPIVVEKPKIKDFDTISAELQHLVYITPLKNLSKALISLNYNGRMPENKVLFNLQLVHNFKTIEKMESLIKAIKDVQ